MSLAKRRFSDFEESCSGFNDYPPSKRSRSSMWKEPRYEKTIAKQPTVKPPIGNYLV